MKRWILAILIFLIFTFGCNSTLASDIDNEGNSTLNDNVLQIPASNNTILHKNYSLNGGSFKDIQNIINNAKAGDTINLSGTFKSKDNNSLIKIDKTLNIISSSNAVLDADSKSGIFYIDTNAKNSIISGLTFTNGKRVIASAIYVDAINITLDKCTFTNNKGTDNGGGAVATTYTLENAEGFIVKNCIFKNNTAPASSGALAAFSKNFKIINTTFENNYVVNNMNRTTVGGALIAGRNMKETNGMIIGCIFKNNYVISGTDDYSFGGAAGIHDNTIIKDCIFLNNKADIGGAIYCYNSTTILNCNFTSNLAKYHGGAIITSDASTININNSNFKYNAAQYCGGAIYTEKSILNIDNVNFDSNMGEIGGAIFTNKTANILNSIFTKNEAKYSGGAITTINDKIIIINTNFNNNNAFDGGAIYSEKNTNSDIQTSNFNSNTANVGGSISIYLSNFKITQSNYTNNSAGAGGAINNHATQLEITYSQFKLNTAEYGGAINNNQHTDMDSCIFMNNTASYGGAIFLDNESKTTINSSNFTNNIADNGSAIYNNATLSVTNTNFKNNLAKTFKITSDNVTIRKGETILIKAVLEVGDNVLDSIFNNANLTIDIEFEQSNNPSNQRILLFLNNEIYIATTNNSGIAIFKIKSDTLEIENYTYTIIYEHSNLYTALYHNGTIEVLAPLKQKNTPLQSTDKSKKENKTKSNQLSEYIRKNNYSDLNDILKDNTKYPIKVNKNYYELKNKYKNDKGIEDYIYHMWLLNWPHTYSIEQYLKDGGIFKIAGILSPQFFIPAYITDYYAQGKIYEYNQNGKFDMFEDSFIHFYGYQSHFSDEPGGAKLLNGLVGINEKGDMSYFDTFLNLISILLSAMVGGSIIKVARTIIGEKRLNIIKQVLSKNTAGEFIYSNFWKIVQNGADSIIVGHDNSKMFQVIINRITSGFIADTSTFLNQVISIFDNPLRTIGDLYKISFRNDLSNNPNNTVAKSIKQDNFLMTTAKTIFSPTNLKKVMNSNPIKKVTKIVKTITEKTKKITTNAISTTKTRLKKTFVKVIKIKNKVKNTYKAMKNKTNNALKLIRNKIKPKYKQVRKITKIVYKSIKRTVKRKIVHYAKKSLNFTNKIYKKLKIW